MSLLFELDRIDDKIPNKNNQRRIYSAFWSDSAARCAGLPKAHMAPGDFYTLLDKMFV